MSKQNRGEFPELALQTVESTLEPARPGQRGLMAEVEVLRDARGQARGWRVRLDNGTEAELPDAEPRLLH